ncbi:VOC family protein [Caldimonas brevitalea]|uniref:Glyoxalase n=1 Tax=Caldimonas brevitalea TaxID=413882 RepID=A0A0G3BGA7_9BURK|nr:VOC family protein [Caldimonas brevitalea]AKJ27003.1 glyoxalase [Caldimonas brevitalea]
MKPKLSLVTLGVRDLARARAFYETGLGWPALSHSNEQVAFFEVGERLCLSLFGWDALAEDAGVPATGEGFRGFSLAHNVASPAEVDAVLAQAVVAGARLVKAGQPVFWGGYSGYFRDPEGVLWEVAHNPYMDLT